MAISDYLEDKWLNTLRGQSFSLANGSSYVKLHKGLPGENGTSNAAVEDTRQPVTWAAPVGNVMSNSTAVTWTNVSYDETYSHASLWDTVGPTGGNCLATGTIGTPKTVTTGDDATFDAGALTFTID